MLFNAYQFNYRNIDGMQYHNLWGFGVLGVATALDKHDVGVGKVHQHAVDGFQIDRRIFPNGRVWAAAGLHPHDAFGGQRAAFGQQALVFLGVDVIGDGDQVVFVAHAFAQHFEQRGFAGAHWAADADAQGRQFLGAVRDVVQSGHGCSYYKKNSLLCN